MDEKVLQKRKLDEEKEKNWQNEKENVSKIREEKTNQDKLNEKGQQDKNKILSKLKEKLKFNKLKHNNSEQLDHKVKPSDGKSLPKGVKKLVGDEYELDKIPGNIYFKDDIIGTGKPAPRVNSQPLAASSYLSSEVLPPFVLFFQWGMCHGVF